MRVDAAEVSELGNDKSGAVEHYDLVRLIRRDPEVVRVVDEQSVGAVNAVDEDLGRSRRTAWTERDLDNGVVAGVCHE